jgi:hypothetical protein
MDIMKDMMSTTMGFHRAVLCLEKKAVEVFFLFLFFFYCLFVEP